MEGKLVVLQVLIAYGDVVVAATTFQIGDQNLEFLDGQFVKAQLEVDHS